MEDRKCVVKKLHQQGYNCAQAFLCSFKDDLPIDEITLFRLAEGLGRGVAGLEALCCVPILTAMLISYLETSDGQLNNPQSKLQSYACAKCLAMEFKEKIGSLKCADILRINQERKHFCCTDVLMMGVEMIQRCLDDQ